MMMVDYEIAGMRPGQVERLSELAQSNNSDLFEKGLVSSIHKCSSEEAKNLCIYDWPQKLRHAGEYDIGGTHTGNESDLWFFYTTSTCPGYNYLLNLFVHHRRPGNFCIGVSNSNELTHTDKPNEVSARSELPQTLKNNTFKSTQANEIHYVKTFCFTEKDMKSLEPNILIIPISIVMNTTNTINCEVLQSIKLENDISGLLAKKEKPDYILISKNGNRFPVHKILLVAHSSILRSLIKDSGTELFIDIQDSDMEVLIQFLYSGTIQNISNQDCMNLLEIAEKFQLQNLFLLTQAALGDQISIETAVEIALISKKYKLDQLQQKVFQFINKNRKVMQTKSWIELNDVELTKQLIAHIHGGDD